MLRITEARTTSKSRINPALAGLLILLGTFSLLAANNTDLSLEKTQELYVRGFSTPPRYSISRGLSAISNWTQIQDGYLLKTPERLFFFSPSLALTNSVKIGEFGSMGATDLKIVADSLIFILDLGSVTQYDLQGNLLRRWIYSTMDLHGFSIAVSDNNILLGGVDWKRDGSMYGYHRLFFYDTATAKLPAVYDALFPKSRLDFLNNEKNLNNFISINVAPFKDGFVVVSGTDPEVFLFSPSGELEKVLKKKPEGYASIDKASAYDRQKIGDRSYWHEWSTQWDYQGSYGIAVLDDSLLIVPRHVSASPYWIDVYDLNERKFLSRLEAPAPIIGASAGQLFFADSTTRNFAMISAYRIIPKRDTSTITDSAKIVRLLRESTSKESESSACSGETGCCSPTSAFEHVQCAPNKLHVVDTIPAGPDRIARVVCNYALAHDSLFQFCNQKKNLFVFVSPTSNAGHKLLDTLSTHIEGKDDWLLTTVVCYPVPSDLDFYLRNLKGDQILINRCVSVPDSTLALSDLGLPPLALALSEGGKEVLSGYSLEPYFDPKKVERGEGITFEEFLKECGIIEQ